jgi:hypothetical protein
VLHASQLVFSGMRRTTSTVASSSSSTPSMRRDAPSTGPVTDDWVHVQWLPHTSVAPTSYVAMILRSAHVTFDYLDIVLGCNQQQQRQQHHHRSIITPASGVEDDLRKDVNQQWKVRITVHGVADQPLFPGSCRTPAADLSPRRGHNNHSATDNGSDDSTPSKEQKTTDAISDADSIALHDPLPNVTFATHDCWWNTYITLPIRWRDLPRDAYLYFEVLAVHDIVVGGVNCRQQQSHLMSSFVTCTAKLILPLVFFLCCCRSSDISCCAAVLFSFRET